MSNDRALALRNITLCLSSLRNFEEICNISRQFQFAILSRYHVSLPLQPLLGDVSNYQSWHLTKYI